jgi:monoterpene epsilon-lactone hydrolase
VASEKMIELLALRHAASQKVLNETRPLAEIRAELDEQTADQILDADVALEPVDAGGVSAVWVTPSGARRDYVYLFFHGGAYVKDNVAVNHKVVIGMCRAFGVRGLTVDYRVAPEHPFPAAVDDAKRAYRYLLDLGIASKHIVSSGSSAGGGLSLALAVACRDDGVPTPAAVVPISPWADLTQSGVSVAVRADRDPNLSKRYLDRFAADYLNGCDPRAPLASPIFADYSGLDCPILAQVGSEEILFDDARRVVDAAQRAGVMARLDVYDRAYHGWQNAGPDLPEAVAAAKSAARFVCEHAGWPPALAYSERRVPESSNH